MSAATRLFVGNIPQAVNEKELQSLFSTFGDVVKLDIKCKPDAQKDTKKFAFVSLSATNHDVESCIKHFATGKFKGHSFYVTRARESFLERLQREREQALLKSYDIPMELKQSHFPKEEAAPKLIKANSSRKKRLSSSESYEGSKPKTQKKINKYNSTIKSKPSLRTDEVRNIYHEPFDIYSDKSVNYMVDGPRRGNAEQKRIESMKKKRQDFINKQNIIKSGLISIDKVSTERKKYFTDVEYAPDLSNNTSNNKSKATNNKNILFNDDESDGEINFEIKKQFEGKKGQKVLDLQSRYKSDKRFVLDERFIDEDSDHEKDQETQVTEDSEQVEIGAGDEKEKQLNILQDVLGVTIKVNNADQNHSKFKPKKAMLRFDPLQPDHAKLLAPIEGTENKTKKKKPKDKLEEVKIIEEKRDIFEDKTKFEVSKEQFYKVSETLKEAIVQPNSFSLRSLFSKSEEPEESTEQEMGYIPIEKSSETKRKNPLDKTESNPFVYDSSDSENEEEKESLTTVKTETKAVWKENFFFSNKDSRFKEALTFFNSTSNDREQKERRELKHLVKKRIHNKERKNQMFKKKIGGRKKIMKKSFKKK